MNITYIIGACITAFICSFYYGIYLGVGLGLVVVFATAEIDNYMETKNESNIN